MKQAQIPAKILFFIIGITIVAIIFVMGIHFIGNVKNSMSQAELKLLEQNIRTDLASVSSNFEEEKQTSYSLPNGVSLCFVDTTKKDQITDTINQYPLMKDSIASGLKENIFIIGESTFHSFYFNKITISQPPYVACFNSIRNEINLKLKGIRNEVIFDSFMPGQKIIQDHTNQIQVDFDISDLTNDLNELDNLDISFDDLEDLETTLYDIDNLE